MKNFKITIKDRKFIVSAEDNVSAVKKLADSLEKETEVGTTVTDSVDPSHIANYGWQLANYNIIHSIYWEAMDEVAGKYEDKNQFLKALATVIDKKFKELVVKTKAEFEKLVNAGMKNVEDTKKKILNGDVGVKFSKVLKGYKGTDSGEEVDEVKAQDANADLISRLKQGKQHVLQNITNTYSIIESALNKNDASQLEFVSGNGKSIGEAIDGTINFCHKELTSRKKTDSDEDVKVDDVNKKDIEYVMNHELPMWMKLVGGSGNTYKVSFNGKIAVIKFDTNWDEWVYTINGKGPFSHSSSEYIGRDIERVLNN